MAFDEKTKIWKNGSFIDWKDATIHLASHVIHYGSSVFEGIRCYRTKRGSAIFRLKDHNRRLFLSAKIYRMPIPFTQDVIDEACREIIRLNGQDEAYIRPIVYRGYAALGIDPSKCPVDTAVLSWKWGTYLGEEALKKGVDVKISSWNRLAPNTMPALAKSGANYMNSQLIKLEALSDGYCEGIALNEGGTLSEGSAENLFIVTNGKLLTPGLADSILPGITRDSVIRIARDMGLEVSEQSIPREMLYTADEAFFSGTAVEITPIRSVDKIPVGSGSRGPLTEAIQEKFFDILYGRAKDKFGWLDFV